ncbi:bi-domain-containing oxidoreductase [Flavobacteriaceae bacterium]|nr:bi-domain-containing oxidoreductase [Flavobacteriaceae bacterium]
MKQAIIKKGIVVAEDVPSPQVSRGNVLVKVVYSCISAGTEISSVKTSGTNIIKRAMENPDLVNKVLESVKKEGIQKVYNKVRGKIDGGTPTGYSLSGVIVEVGNEVRDFKVGDRVAAAGAGIANHAEYVNVPQNLTVKIPDELSFQEASTITLGAIAMQGVRRLELKMGEYAVVFGTGILGLLAVQMLNNAGVRVAAIDFDSERLQIARESGAEIIINPNEVSSLNEVSVWTHGKGADAVLFSAATADDKPLSQSYQMCRRKGRVVMLGVAGMNMKREDMYMKELDFMMSTSYGPGRYDKYYEEKGIDYPYAYVRWTENRNMKEYLRLLSANKIDLSLLINGEFPIEDVTNAYESLKDKTKKSLIVLLSYGQGDIDFKKIETYNKVISKDKINVGFIGAGGFVQGVHLPNMKKLGSKFNLHAVANRTGISGKNIANQYGFKYATTDSDEIINDSDIDLIIIATPHDSHGTLTLKALKAGKHVFVEKPLVTSGEELNAIKEFYNSSEETPMLFVGFNRRFSKYATSIKKHVAQRQNPLLIRYRMNAGFIPYDHWIHEDGGRMVGEACHIVDLMTYLTGSSIESINCQSLTIANGKFKSDDNKSITLKYADGSVCAIDYFSIGNNSLSKEFMEVHFDGKSIILDDYKKLKGYGVNLDMNTRKSEKGQYEELLVLYDYLTGKTTLPPIPLDDIFSTTKVTFLINKC